MLWAHIRIALFIILWTENISVYMKVLMNYCASDVEATLEVFKVLWPEFNVR